MAVSELITLVSTANNPSQYVMPDFSGLARRLDEQTRAHFVQKEQNDYYRQYRLLSEIWFQAGSIRNPENRSRRFEKVMEESQNFLVLTQDVMPEINPFYARLGSLADACPKRSNVLPSAPVSY